MRKTLLYSNLYSIWFFGLYYSFGLSIETLTKVPPKVQDILKMTDSSDVHKIVNGTRRIIDGGKVLEGRRYMVYLKLPMSNLKYKDYRLWLCAGVIIHESYILTSAACIEDARHFYIVSGTYRYDPEFDRRNNNCFKNGAKKAVWKCIPRNYIFDGHENDNLRWMNNDIAIVKVEDEFDFTRKVRGCDFIPQPIRYNNHNRQLENPGTDATIAGWGSTYKYSEFINRRSPTYTQDLLETDVKIISKNKCKRRWGPRYHNIIDNYMICTKDSTPDLSSLCQEKYADCTDIMYSDELVEGERRRILNPKNLVLHSAYHNSTRRRTNSGGFCENDHGGPLVYDSGVNAIVIGIISACLVKEGTNVCYGPYLYTSVYKNRMLINCAINKDVGENCNKLFRTSETHDETEITWIDHPDGPAKNELNKTRRDKEEPPKEKILNSTKLKVSDTAKEHAGIVLRATNHTT